MTNPARKAALGASSALRSDEEGQQASIVLATETGAVRRLTVSLPLPSADLQPNRPRHFMVRAEAKKIARFEVMVLATQARFWADWLTCGPCRVTVQVTWPDKRRRDLDNLLASCKAYWDGFTDARVWEDDSLVTWVLPPARVDKLNAGIVVTVEPIEGAKP